MNPICNIVKAIDPAIIPPKKVRVRPMLPDYSIVTGLGSLCRGDAPLMTKAIPQYASAKNALAISPPFPATGATIVLGMWRMTTHIKIIVPKRAAITLGLILKMIAIPTPINAEPVKYIQNKWSGIHDGI